MDTNQISPFRCVDFDGRLTVGEIETIRNRRDITMLLILLIVILLLAFGGGGGYYGYRRWGTGGGIGIFGLVLIVVVLFYVFGGMRMH